MRSGRGRIADHVAQLARVARVGRDEGLREGRDPVGQGIRASRPAMAAGRRSEMLREADVEVVSGPELRRDRTPTLTRARRYDPLVKLQKAGSIVGRHVDAAEMLREQIEQSQSGVCVPPVVGPPARAPADQHHRPADRGPGTGQGGVVRRGGRRTGQPCSGRSLAATWRATPPMSGCKAYDAASSA